MPEGPGAVQTLPIGCISVARRYMHFGDPSAGPADLQKVINVRLCANQNTSFAVKCLPCAYQDFERFGGGFEDRSRTHRRLSLGGL
jgi:hypothetical protein